MPDGPPAGPSAAIGGADWTAAHDRARRVPARSDPHPVDQPARPAGSRARRGRPDRRTSCARPASRPRSWSRPPAAGQRRRAAPRRRHGRRPAAPPVAPRRRPGRARGLDARAVRGRPRRRLRLGARRGRHEGDGGAGGGRPRGCSRARARDAGLDPATDPIPGLRRDVLFASTADEEAGGWNGAGWLVDHRPETLRAAGALNEAGGMPIEVGGRRFYAIMVAEKGYETYRDPRARPSGATARCRATTTPLVRAAHVVTRIAVPGEPRPTPVVRRLLAEVGAALPPDQAALMAAIVGRRPAPVGGRAAAACDPAYARHARRAAARHVQPRRSCTRASSTT